MEIVDHKTAGDFLGRAGPWLEEAEAENNLILGIASSLVDCPERYGAGPCLITVEHGRRVVGAALMTPPRKLMITRSSVPALGALVEYLHETAAAVPGVLGPSPETEDFARRWAELTEKSSRLEMGQRIYQCDGVIHPTYSPGHLQPATEADFPLLVRWQEAFNRDVGLVLHEDTKSIVRKRIADGQSYVWENGQVTSMASWARETANGVAVNMVYTPPEFRGKGYATSCAASLTQLLLDSGRARCFLHADLANPTSNGIYQRIGYRPVCDYQEWSFH